MPRRFPFVLVLVLVLASAVLGCDGDGGPTAGVPAPVIVALKDGNLAALDRGTNRATAGVAPPMAVSTDAVLRAPAGSSTLYVVNRYGFDNVVILSGTPLVVQRQLSTGPGSNPQDVAVVASNRLYIPLLGTGEVLIADPTRAEGDEVVGRIDLKTIDPDPAPTSISWSQTRSEVYVALAFTDPATYQPKRAGMVAVIDLATDTIVARIDLESRNPFARMMPVVGGLVVNGADDFSGQGGCFEAVDVAARTSRCVVQNAACGGWSGSLTAITHEPEGVVDVWAAVAAGYDANGTICHFRLDGTVVRAGIATNGSITDVMLDLSGLYAVDSKAPGGLRLFDVATDTEITTAPLDLGGVPAFASGIVLLP